MLLQTSFFLTLQIWFFAFILPLPDQREPTRNETERKKKGKNATHVNEFLKERTKCTTSAS